MTISETLDRYTDHIEAYYRNPDGTPTGTADDIKSTLSYLRKMFTICHFASSTFGVSSQYGRRSLTMAACAIK